MFSLRIWKQPNSGGRYLVDTASSRYGMDPSGHCWGRIPGLHNPALHGSPTRQPIFEGRDS